MKNNQLQMQAEKAELNRQEIATVIYEELLSMADSVSFGSIGVTLIMHNGIISKVEFCQERKSRIGGM